MTAIATGFGSSFEKGKRGSEELKGRNVTQISKIDRDVPTFIRDKQKDAPTGLRVGLGDEMEYDIPTFLRKRVD